MATSAAIMASAAVHSSGSSEPLSQGAAVVILIVLALSCVPCVWFRKRIKAQAFDRTDYIVCQLGAWCLSAIGLFCLLGGAALIGIALGY